MIRLAQVLTLASLSWGALAFGGTYRWASLPLVIGMFAAAAVSLIASRGIKLDFKGFCAAAVPLVAAIALQIVPISPALLERLSPATSEALRALNIRYSVAGGWHPLSINPELTGWALVLVGALLTFCVALARLLSVTGTRWLTHGIAALGAALAVIGLIFETTGEGRVYGFWLPQLPNADPFGPFINPNHFAGWMLMAVPLALALICGAFTAGEQGTGGWRDRLLWLSSKRASQLTLLMLATILMGVALVLTLSRAALAAMMIALVVLTAFMVWRGRATPARVAAGLIPIALFAGLAIWTGYGAIVTELQSEDSPLQHRLGAWRDASDIAARFPVTGTGLNTYGTATLLYQRHNMRWHYAHAHNDYLQLRAEGGYLVTVPALVLAAVFAWTVARRFREDSSSESSWWARAGAVAGLAGIAVQEVAEFSLQMPANAVMFAALCAVALHGSRRRRRGVSGSSSTGVAVPAT